MQNKVRWWQVFLLPPLMIGLIMIERVLPLPGVSAGMMDTGIVLLMFGAMLIWIRVNSGALERYYMEKDGSLEDIKVTVYVPQASTTDAQGPGDDASHASVTSVPDHPRVWLSERDGNAPWSLN